MVGVMSAWTTNRSGYNQHKEEAGLPPYDSLFSKAREEKLEIITNEDWHHCVEEDTDEC
ncbi:MAG TPA: hypothetical protein VJH88_00590 [Candidatus Nanoarchaeia archaeon]|nr:hypothetical protein [Candidatus Nanoarchaeia archaeon]